MLWWRAKPEILALSDRKRGPMDAPSSEASACSCAARADSERTQSGLAAEAAAEAMQAQGLGLQPLRLAAGTL